METKHKIRKIIHVDMDAFYAAIEQRDHREFRGKPLVVGGPPNSRGVVATCSYEARKFGIHSAMPSSQAYRLCPSAIFTPPRFAVYKEVSGQIREIFFEYTDLVEPLSLDEAYLDVTENKKNIPSATRIAWEIKKKIKKITGLTASAGVSYNKFIAKVASDIDKPDGLTIIRPEEGEKFIEKLPIGKFYGVGKVTEKKMLSLEISTGADLKKKTQEWLTENFGKAGSYFYHIARGIDHRPVNPEWIRKSIGKERTLSKDIDDKKVMLEILEELAKQVEAYMKKTNVRGKTVTLKVKFFDFTQITRSITIPEPIQEASQMMNYIDPLLSKTEAGNIKVRLLGLSLSNLCDQKSKDPQPPLGLEIC